MADTKTGAAAGQATGAEDADKKALSKKKKELAELRTRTKIASEHVKAATQTKKELMARTEALATEMGKSFKRGKGKPGAGRAAAAGGASGGHK